MNSRETLSVPDQIALCIGFFTRIPVTLPEALPGDALARAVWAFPLAGAAVGALSALVMVAALELGLDGAAAAILGLAAGMLLTGALHEDGLADTADGFGGGRDAPAKLAIMRDSRIGSYGVLALMVSLALRAVCLGRIAGGGEGTIVTALIAAHAASRASLPAVMSWLPLARADGAAAAAGRPGAEGAVRAALLGLVLVMLCLGPGRGILGLLLVAATVLALGRLASRQIGGYTGDVLGMVEQVVEALLLLVAAHG